MGGEGGIGRGSQTPPSNETLPRCQPPSLGSLVSRPVPAPGCPAPGRPQTLPGLTGRPAVSGLAGKRGGMRHQAHSARSTRAGARSQRTEPALGREGGSWSLSLHPDGGKEGKARKGP